MCLPKPKTPKIDLMPSAPPLPEAAPKAPVLNENKKPRGTMKGRSNLRIDLNPAASAGLRP